MKSMAGGSWRELDWHTLVGNVYIFCVIGSKSIFNESKHISLVLDISTNLEEGVS